MIRSPLAQLVSASASGAEGSWFKSRAGCQLLRLCNSMVECRFHTSEMKVRVLLQPPLQPVSSIGRGT